MPELTASSTSDHGEGRIMGRTATFIERLRQEDGA